MRTTIALLGLAALGLGCASTSEPSSPSPSAFHVSSHTGGRAACLLVASGSGETVVRADPTRCGQRFSPASTFKIPNSIIGLETKAVTDADSVVPWDREKYPQQAWWPTSWTDREHDLRSAFRHSFVPFYRALATRIGHASMQRYIEQFGYGNRSIGGSLDSFWLDGEIAISADEQVAFLRRFHAGKLGVSPRTTEIVKDILVREKSGERVLSAKTGTGNAPDGTAIGWIVGYVEAGSDVHFFAFNVSGATSDDIPRAWRDEILKRMLGELHIWE